MKTACPFSLHWLRGVSAVALLILLRFGLFAQASGTQPAKGKASKVAKMIDALANRNQPPRLVGRGYDRHPLFRKDYNWREQDRIVKVLEQLSKDMTEELWEELFRKIHDRRYSLTVMDQGERASNWSVGSICYGLAVSGLTGIYTRHWPTVDGRYIEGYSGIEHLAAWRAKRKQKALYELQIELCEGALSHLEKVSRISPARKARVRKKIMQEIQKLRMKKIAILRPTNKLAFYYLYNGKVP